jgi:hypothetical protein
MVKHIGIVACSAEGAPIPTLDSTRLLAKAALRKALEEDLK